MKRSVYLKALSIHFRPFAGSGRTKSLLTALCVPADQLVCIISSRRSIKVKQEINTGISCLLWENCKAPPTVAQRVSSNTLGVLWWWQQCRTIAQETTLGGACRGELSMTPASQQCSLFDRAGFELRGDIKITSGAGLFVEQTLVPLEKKGPVVPLNWTVWRDDWLGLSLNLEIFPFLWEPCYNPLLYARGAALTKLVIKRMQDKKQNMTVFIKKKRFHFNLETISFIAQSLAVFSPNLPNPGLYLWNWNSSIERVVRCRTFIFCSIYGQSSDKLTSELDL
ncbi:hypothetical protein RRG08_009724 [Elysia crispata]|uniref:Uncharacterized protein n=1 Tax=Elysia crispata TaxID=231223 RepID=A0AAE0Y801_9GAST|nr:hypothetical protein RRG08_009724 [Elysia crispata]